MSAPIAVLALLWVWMASATGAGAQVLPPLAAASPAQAEAAVAAVPLPAPVDSLWWAKLVAGDVVADGRRLQAQVVARWPDGRPRRALLRWTGMPLEERVAPTADIDPAPRHTAGWEYAYRLVAASADSVPWKTALRRLPLVGALSRRASSSPVGPGCPGIETSRVSPPCRLSGPTLASISCAMHGSAV